MKLRSLFLLPLVIGVLGCVKVEHKPQKAGKSSNVPELERFTIPQVSVHTTVRQGHRCDLIGETETKEVFLYTEINKKDIVILQFRDIDASDHISAKPMVEFENFFIHRFFMDEEKEGTGHSGRGLFPTRISTTPNGDRILTTEAKISLDEDLNGKIEIRQNILKADSKTDFKTTAYKDLAEIKNCVEIQGLGPI